MITDWAQYPQHKRAIRRAAFRAKRQTQRMVIAEVWTREHAQCQVCKRPVLPAGHATSVAATGYVQDRSRLFTDAGRCRLLCGLHFNRTMGRQVITTP